MCKTLFLLVILVFFGHRLNAQYVIDSTFNLTGTNEFTMWPGNIVNGEKLAYTATNDIIVAGRWINRLTVWKYNQTGDLDTTFGIGGLSYIEMPAGVSTWVRDVEIQPDGKIVVLAEGELINFSNFNYSLSTITLGRFLPNGDPDSSFNSTGLLNIDLLPSYEYHPRCLVLDTLTNSIFVGGWNVDYGSYHCPIGVGNWFIAKFKENGSLDATFNSTGFIQSTSGALAQTYTTITPMAQVLDIKLLEGGKIRAVGAFHNLDSTYFSLQLNANGDYDSLYGVNGISLKLLSDFGTPLTELTYAHILNDESAIFNSQYVIDGFGSIPDSSNIHVYKMDANGNTETSFGNNGFLMLSQTSNRTWMTVDNQGRVVYAWYTPLPTGTQTVYFRRLLSNGVPDLSFGVGGILTSEPVQGDVYMSECTLRDIKINTANDDLTLVAFRSANYVPTTFRVLNYSINQEPSATIPETYSEDLSIMLYPNPNNGVFTIAASESSTFHIYSTTGAMILKGNLNIGINSINLSEFNKGVYFIHITHSEGKVICKKIIIR